MRRIKNRDRFFSFFIVLLLGFPLYASAGLLDLLSAYRSGSTSTSTTTPSPSTTSSTSTKTVTYTPSNWPQALQGDLFLPPQDGKADPVVLLLHGGGWQRGDKSSYSGLGKTLASRGYAAFAINYRFAPGSTHPAQLQDMQQALRYLVAHAAELGLDVSRFATWGYSAGGHLAALLAVQPASDLPPVRVVLAGAPPSDLTAPEARDESSVKLFMGGSYSQIPALYEQASPARQVRTGMAPVFLYHGTADTTVPPLQSENFARTLQAASVPVEVVWLQGLDHSQASGATSQYRDKALAFLDRHINADAGGLSPTAPLPTDPVVTAPVVTDPVVTAPSTGSTSGTTSGSLSSRLRSFFSR